MFPQMKFRLIEERIADEATKPVEEMEGFSETIPIKELVEENLRKFDIFSVRNLMIISENTDIVFQYVCEIMENLKIQYKSFVGSNFPEDSEELHISKIIN